MFEATTTSNVVEVDFASRRTRRPRKLAGHALSKNVLYLPRTDCHSRPNPTPEMASLIEGLSGNIITVLIGMGYEAEAEHLQTTCSERAVCGDSLSDIYTMAMAYTRNVDDRIHEYFKHSLPSAANDSRS